MSELKLRGILPAFPTPTTENGTVDVAALRGLVKYLLEGGSDGLVPIGGTGEFTAQSPAARTQVVATTVEVTAGKVPVVAGIVSPGWAEAVQAGKDFRAVGADALLLVAPFYVTPTQAGIRDYFRAYRDTVDLPIVFYDIPYRTRSVADPNTIAGLAAEGVIVGMKVCNTDIHHTNVIASQVDQDFAMLSGEDTLFPAHVALGACGGILASATMLPGYWRDIYRNARDGRIFEAISKQRRLLPLLAALFAEVNPGPLKEAMNLLGVPCGHALPPLRRPSEDTMAKLRKAIEDLRVAGITS